MKNLRQKVVFIAATLAALTLLSACVFTPPPDLATPTTTPTWTGTPLPSATIDWFPATFTHTPRVTQEIPPTATVSLWLGQEVLSDQFAEPEFWPTKRDWNGKITLANHSLTLAVTGDKGNLSSIRTAPVLRDFYAEINVDVALCRGGDTYGLLLRTEGEAYNYRWVLSCDGRTRLERVRGGGPFPLVDWMHTTAIRSGAPKTQTLGVWLAGSEMRFFIDGTEIFSARDPLYAEGLIGVFAKAEGNSPVTVSFLNLHVAQVRTQDLPTKTPVPSATLPPTRTLAPTK